MTPIELKEYIWAWLAYLGGCSVLLVIGWRWTRHIRHRTPKYMLRLGVAAALLTPISHENASMLKVPAIAVGGFGWLTGDSIAAVSALNYLAMVVTGALVLAVALAYAEKRLPPWLRSPEPPPRERPPTAKAATPKGPTSRKSKAPKTAGRKGQRIEPTLGGSDEKADEPAT